MFFFHFLSLKTEWLISWDVMFALISDAYSSGLVKYRDPYPFGVDPSWRGSRSELPFLNSLKMKMSILLGVAQMNLGILLSYFDARFFGSSLDIRCVLLSTLFISDYIPYFTSFKLPFHLEGRDWSCFRILVSRYQFVPQMIFLNSLFGYLSLLIVIKWCTGSQADLYHVMIYMFLSPTDDLGENQLFWGQRPLQAWSSLFYLLSRCLKCYIILSVVNIEINWCLTFADSVVAFGFSCSSMDALSKTFYFKKATFGGNLVVDLSCIYFFCRKSVNILTSLTIILEIVLMFVGGAFGLS